MTGGVLVVDKPAGPTSFDVVSRVRRLLGAAKAGHAGTLDPMATGVLAICLDDAVKLQQFLAGEDKAYEAVVAFGAATDTEDAEGKVVERGDPSGLDAAAVAAALPGFLGEIRQVPPMYSAVRVAGRRLHRAARAGETVVRPPRTVRIEALELLSFRPAGDGPALARLAIRCGKGTYVRALASDLGRAVGVPAHLASLRRTASGPFSLDRAVPLAAAERLGRDDPAALRARLVPPAEALAFLPALALTGSQALELSHGRALELPMPRGPCRALDAAGRLVAVCAAGDGWVRPVRVLASPAEMSRKITPQND